MSSLTFEEQGLYKRAVLVVHGGVVSPHAPGSVKAGGGGEEEEKGMKVWTRGGRAE